MREIKFRIWDKELKESHIEKLQDLCEDDYWYDGKTEVWSVLYDCSNEQERFIAMQFTGLYDKNGKEIYEGDIVEIDKDVAKTFNIYSKGIINYLNGGFIVTKNDGSYETIKSALLILGDLNNIFRGKVIGNIYENPDLLKGADNIE